MDLSQKLLAFGLALFFFIALLRIFSTPLRLAGKLLLNALLGFLGLWLVQATTIFTGITLGINLFTLLTTAILGLPGFVLLLLLQWVI